ncbi:MAG: hypothetical protein ACLSA2_01275 [Candidatus Gastranaerophilaceae bacterium]
MLITLGIIGVVAAMTMPSLIQKHKEKEYAAKLKKFSSMMSQALITTVSNEGEIADWGLTQFTTSEGLTEEELELANKSRNLFADKVKNYLKVIQYCPYGEGCKTGVTNGHVILWMGLNLANFHLTLCWLTNIYTWNYYYVT